MQSLTSGLRCEGKASKVTGIINKTKARLLRNWLHMAGGGQRCCACEKGAELVEQ